MFLSDRWADMFSAKGCRDDPEHSFSHPFVQVRQQTAGDNIAPHLRYRLSSKETRQSTFLFLFLLILEF